MTPDDFTPRRLLDLVDCKFACLRQLRDLGVQQQSLIDAGEITALLRLLADKQRLIDDLHRLERNLDPFREQDPERRAWASDAERLRCASLAEQSARLLREVLDGEKRCEELLQRRRDDTAERLAAVQTAGMARGAYAPQDDYSVSTLDLSTDS